MQSVNRQQGLGTFSLMLLITGAIDSIRNLPATALAGPSLIFFFLFSAAVFLVPVALVSARLASASPDRGGIYQWVGWGIGKKTAMLAVWLQWINTMVWFPTILSFIAGTAAWLIYPALATNKTYLVMVVLTIFWTMTLMNLRGVRASAKFANSCSVIGMLVPMILIIGLAVVFLLSGRPLQIHFTLSNVFPALTKSEHWFALTAIMTAFLGMELATVHVREIKTPEKTFPKALFFSVIVILATMIMGSLAIAFVLPAKEISLVGGVMQAFSQFFAVWHLGWMVPVMTVMLLAGSLGGVTSWIISPARGLLQAAEHGFLPTFLTHKNSFGVSHRLLILQASLVTLVCLAFLLMPDVNGSYWLLSALSTQLYILMYILMFIAAMRLEKKIPNRKGIFSLPGGRWATWLVCLLGLSGCFMTLIVGFIPPAGIDVGGFLKYECLFGGGMFVMIVPVLFFYGYRYSQTIGKWTRPPDVGVGTPVVPGTLSGS